MICTFYDTINYVYLKLNAHAQSLFRFPTTRRFHFNPTIKRAASGRIGTLLLCAPTPPSPTLWTTTTGPTHHQEKSVIVIVTARSKLCLLLHRCLTPAPAASQPPAKPPRSADIPPDSAPLPFQSREPAYYDGLALLTAQGEAIQRWELPRRRDYGTLARRISTFYQKAAPWDPEGKPVGFIANAGFYYDGEFTVI